MLYSEFLAVTGAVENQASYNEYKRVEQIYMESNHCTKEDAYRMAKVETKEEHEYMLIMKRAAEVVWVKRNLLPAAAFIRGMSEKENYFSEDYVYISECGNIWRLKRERSINYESVVLYSLWCNGAEIDMDGMYLDRSEFPPYRADWHDKSLKELEDLFGYIA